MIDNDVQAVAGFAGLAHRAVREGGDGRALVRGKVKPVVEARLTGDGTEPAAERGRQRAGSRRGVLELQRIDGLVNRVGEQSLVAV